MVLNLGQYAATPLPKPFVPGHLAMARNVFSCHNSEVKDGGRGSDFKEAEARKVADHSARRWTVPTHGGSGPKHQQC